MNKKNLLLTLTLFFCISGFSQRMNLNHMRLGIGGYFVTEIDELGYTINGVYEFLDYWEFAGKITYVPKKDLAQWNIIDIDAHYIFLEQSKKMKLYGLGGMAANILVLTIPEISIGGGDIEPETKKTEVQFALNVGAGINFMLSKKITVSPELRISFREDPYFRFGLTAQYNF